jgi:cellobiose phosphorylase
MLIARASAAAGEDDRVWRVLEWLHGVAGRSGSWFERYGQSITPPMPPVGVVGWIWYEIINLCSQQVAGIRPSLEALEVRPRLLSGMQQMSASQSLRGAGVEVHVSRTTGSPRATVNGRNAAVQNRRVRLPLPRKGTTLNIVMEL